jgi:hypothetical protein
MRSGDLGGQNWSDRSSFPTRPIHRWGRNSFRKRRTSRCHPALAVVFENLGLPLLKCYVDHSHTMYSSGNIDVQNWVLLFESHCILPVSLHGPEVFKVWTHHSYLPLTATITRIPQQPFGHSYNKCFAKKYEIQSRRCKWVVWTNV